MTIGAKIDCFVTMFLAKTGVGVSLRFAKTGEIGSDNTVKLFSAGEGDVYFASDSGARMIPLQQRVSRNGPAS